jgi:Leucine Rich repeats (2 copies)
MMSDEACKTLEEPMPSFDNIVAEATCPVLEKPSAASDKCSIEDNNNKPTTDMPSPVSLATEELTSNLPRVTSIATGRTESEECLTLDPSLNGNDQNNVCAAGSDKQVVMAIDTTDCVMMDIHSPMASPDARAFIVSCLETREKIPNGDIENNVFSNLESPEKSMKDLIFSVESTENTAKDLIGLESIENPLLKLIWPESTENPMKDLIWPESTETTLNGDTVNNLEGKGKDANYQECKVAEVEDVEGLMVKPVDTLTTNNSDESFAGAHKRHYCRGCIRPVWLLLFLVFLVLVVVAAIAIVTATSVTGDNASANATLTSTGNDWLSQSTQLPTTSGPTFTPFTPLPTLEPTLPPTESPTASVAPTNTAIPSVVPSDMPSGIPSGIPSNKPTLSPTLSAAPSGVPSISPSSPPSLVPSSFPSVSMAPSVSAAPTTVMQFVLIDLIENVTNASFEVLLDPETPQGRAMRWMTTVDKVVMNLFEGVDTSLGELQIVATERNSTPPVAPGVGEEDTLIPVDPADDNSTENVSTMFLPPSGSSGVVVSDAWELTVAIDDDSPESAATMFHVPPGSLGPLANEVLLVLPQRYALIALDFSLHTDSDTTWSNPDLHECEWPGVKCDSSDEVIGINWARQNLTGYVVPEISLLTELESLDLAQNQIAGSVDVFWKLPRLKRLYLFNNNFVGSIETDIGRMYSLEHLYLGHNNLSGELPEELFELDDLSEYHLSLAAMHWPLELTCYSRIISLQRVPHFAL